MRTKYPVTVHILLLRGEKVLMLRRYNTGYEDGNYSVVAGHLEGGETIINAAIREIEEEVGVHINGEDIQVVGVMHRKSDDERVDFFLTTDMWSGEPTNQELDKCDDLGWYSLNSLPVNTIPYVRQAIEYYQKGIWFHEFGW